MIKLKFIVAHCSVNGKWQYSFILVWPHLVVDKFSRVASYQVLEHIFT